MSLDDGEDGTLEGRRPLETISIDAHEELFLQIHFIEALNDLVSVGLSFFNRNFIGNNGAFRHSLVDKKYRSFQFQFNEIETLLN